MGASALVSGAGNLLSAYGTAQQAGASAAASEYNALLADFNAEISNVQTEQQITQLRVQGRKVLGDMRASYGASGVAMEGSALDVMQESAAALETDALNLKFQGELRAAAYRNDATLSRFSADAARTGGRIGALAGLAGGGSKMIGKY